MKHARAHAVRGIGLYVNADKTHYMCFKQGGAISNFRSNSFKLVDQFTYLGSNISSTESDVNIQLGKAWTIIDNLSIIWKSDHYDE